MMFFGIGFSTRLCALDIILYVLFQSIRVITDRVLPTHWFDPELPYFRTKAWENDGKFYQDHFYISKWKDKLPAIDGLNTVSKKKLGTVSPEYLRQLIIETCRGESHHLRTILETVFFILWNPFGLSCCIFILSIFLNLPFIFIQRYNRPRLERLLVQIESHSCNSTATRP
jgi:glycosyl-4,4'-diaponeurosporenoate acyltransferase